MFCMKNLEQEEICTYHFRFPKHRFDSYRSVLKKEFKTKKCNYYISFFHWNVTATVKTCANILKLEPANKIKNWTFLCTYGKFQSC